MTEDVTWNVTEGFPFTGIYKGLENVLHGFYAKLFEGLDKFYANKWKWIDAGDYVIVLGYYIIKVKNMTDKNQVRFAHIWEIKNNKIAGVWQVADTAKLPSFFRLNILESNHD